jgi:hypothetical protein
MNDFNDSPKPRFFDRFFPRQAGGLMDDLGQQEQEPVQPAGPEIVHDRFTIRLNSLVKGATFRAEFDVEFYGEGDGAQLRDRLRLRLQLFAEEMAAALNVTHASNLQNLINGKLNNQQKLEGITIVRASVAVRVAEDALAVGREWEELSRRQGLDQLRRRVELEELAFLRDEIYSKPEVARGLWLRNHPDATDELLDDRFDRIAEKFRQSKASAEGAADAAQALIGRLVSEFLTGLSDAERAFLFGQLGRLFTSYGRDDLREQL